MNAPTFEGTSAEKSLAVRSDVNPEVRKLAEHESSKPPVQIEQNAKHKIEMDAERIRSSVARLTSNSIGELEGLASELHKLDEFLKSETGRVQREIQSVLAGIQIIVDAIAPWKRPSPASAGVARPASGGAKSSTPMGLGDARHGR